MLLRVEQGKGRKDRYAQSPMLRQRQRVWWRAAHAQGKSCPVAGSSRGSTQLVRSPPGTSSARCAPRPRPPGSTSASAPTRCAAILSPGICRDIRAGGVARQAAKTGRSLGICSPATLRGVTGDDRDSDTRGSTGRADACSRICAGVGDELDRPCAGPRELARPARDLRPNICTSTSRTLLLLLYAAGLRISEALNLDLADVELESGSTSPPRDQALQDATRADRRGPDAGSARVRDAALQALGSRPRRPVSADASRRAPFASWRRRDVQANAQACGGAPRRRSTLPTSAA
jgi:hypothetical protein